jgi:hypothetical protein
MGARTDVDVGLHLPLTRVAGLDVGASHLLIEQDGGAPAVSVSGRVYLLGNVRAITGPGRVEPRLFEELDAIASWKVRPTLLLYAGALGFFQAERGGVYPGLLAAPHGRGRQSQSQPKPKPKRSLSRMRRVHLRLRYPCVQGTVGKMRYAVHHSIGSPELARAFPRPADRSGCGSAGSGH